MCCVDAVSHNWCCFRVFCDVNRQVTNVRVNVLFCFIIGARTLCLLVMCKVCLLFCDSKWLVCVQCKCAMYIR